MHAMERATSRRSKATPLGGSAPSATATDDVIAHLVLMRTDEHLFWRKANQHGELMPATQL